MMVLIHKLIPGPSFAISKTIDSGFIDTDLLLMMKMVAKSVHAHNFVASSRDFSTKFVKSVIDLKNS